MVAALGELTAHTLPHMRNRMLLSKSGRNILRDRPLISSDLLLISSISEANFGTFGFAYKTFLETNELSPDTRSPVTISHVFF